MVAGVGCAVSGESAGACSAAPFLENGRGKIEPADQADAQETLDLLRRDDAGNRRRAPSRRATPLLQDCEHAVDVVARVVTAGCVASIDHDWDGLGQHGAQMNHVVVGQQQQ